MNDLPNWMLHVQNIIEYWPVFVVLVIILAFCSYRLERQRTAEIEQIAKETAEAYRRLANGDIPPEWLEPQSQQENQRWK